MTYSTPELLEVGSANEVVLGTVSKFASNPNGLKEEADRYQIDTDELSW